MSEDVRVRVKFTTDADDHSTLMPRARAVEWLKSRNFLQLHNAENGSVIDVDDFSDEELVRAIATATSRWLDEADSGWVRFSESDTDDSARSPSFASVRKQSIRSLRVTVEAPGEEAMDEGNEGSADQSEPAPPANRWDEFTPGDGWIN